MDSRPQAQPDQDRLALLYRLSQTFNSSLDLNEVLNRVMDEVIAAMRAERGFVMLREADDTLSFKAARGIDQQTIAAPRFQISHSIVQQVARDGKPVLTSDAQLDDRFSTRQSVMVQGLRAVICVPLVLKDKNIGVIYVDSRLHAALFADADLELLVAIASSAAIAIENARLYQVAVEKGRLERELQMAREVQISLLPQSMPAAAGWAFAAKWQPAREVAGDYYDFIPLEGDKLGLVIADVTGKGMPAALFMASTRNIVRASVARASSPAEGITHANRLICAESSRGMFVTLFYLQLEAGSGEVEYVNAGHNPPLFYDASDDSLTPLTRTGMALGVQDGELYQRCPLLLKSGDFVLFFTDGVTEAFNPEGQEFGVERLEEVVNAHRHQPAGRILTALERAVQEFAVAGDPFDDITILVVRRL